MSSKKAPEDSSAAPVAPKGLIEAGETLNSSSASYLVQNFIGEGKYGKVVESINVRTKQKVAIKLLKKGHVCPLSARQEVAMLRDINQLNPKYSNMVRFFEGFQHMENTCLVFEMLDRSLFNHIKQREWKPLPLHEIRPIAKQLMMALNALVHLAILHTDIKPDNVMLVNMQDQPLRIKLIDFGCAMMSHQVRLGMKIQPCGYRAPEVSLGLPFTQAVDVWGVGCVLAFLFVGKNLFPFNCIYQTMKCIVGMLGQPENTLISAGIYSKHYFLKETSEAGSSWRLMTEEEFTQRNRMRPKKCHSSFRQHSSLKSWLRIPLTETEDHLAFRSLLEAMLHLHLDERIYPYEALQHPFLSMSHLTEDVHGRDYLNTSIESMKVCPNESGFHYGPMDNHSLAPVVEAKKSSDPIVVTGSSSGEVRDEASCPEDMVEFFSCLLTNED